uniref:Aminotransferase n=1 Tax=Eiseniibacteriota bacterium TaxID=2212470 RepID=A0A832I4R6_UNCEI
MSAPNLRGAMVNGALGAAGRPGAPDETCFHGGAFFEAIGDGFESLERRHRVINADVLDAWFPPAPEVLTALREHLDWAVRTSPPTHAEGLRRAVARARGVPEECVVVGAGSSDLIFRAFCAWLTPTSSALLLDPTYGEYAHVLERVIGCRVERLPLARAADYDLSPERLARALDGARDLAVLVNPNSPTGRHVPAAALARALGAAPPGTRVWVDETYAAYAGAGESLEGLAARSRGIVTCTSMSKVYALSGMRVAYLVTDPDTARALRRRTPPWPVGLPAQIAAVRALGAADHYRARWAETHRLRAALAAGLATLGGIEVVPGVANFLLCHLAGGLPTAAAVVAACRERGLFLRDAGAMSPSLGARALRVAVKDAATQRRMLAILADALGRPRRPRGSGARARAPGGTRRAATPAGPRS